MRANVRAINSWIVVMMGLMLGSARAAVPIAEDGQARAAIVHNGCVQQAKDLQGYIKQMTGAELPLATNAAAADALNLPGRIVLDTVSKVTGASPYGLLDMAGNVWEWVGDWYDYSYYKTAPDKNPTGPGKGAYKVLRGGCALYDERFCRTAARMINPPQVRDWTCTGFRCVVNAPGPKSEM